MPDNLARDDASSAISAAIKQSRDEGKVSARTLAEAHDSLYGYGRPALNDLPQKHSPTIPTVKRFLTDLDKSLDTLAEPKAPAAKAANAPAEKAKAADVPAPKSGDRPK